MKKGRLLLTIALLMGICTLCAAQENEAYAVYNESNKRLVFCYDENRDKKTGETFDLNTGLELPGWHDKEIVSVSFHSTFSEVRPTTTRAWFEGQTSLVEISGIKYLNTSEVTDMGWMFFSAVVWRVSTQDFLIPVR